MTLRQFIIGIIIVHLIIGVIILSPKLRHILGIGEISFDCSHVPLNDKDYACKEAKKGDANAQYVCAAYLTGDKPRRISPLPEDAFKWFLASASQGYTKAQGYLCRNYFVEARGDIQRRGLKNQLKYCYKAAKKNHANAQETLGMLFFEGVGVKQDYGKSYYWFKVFGKTMGRSWAQDYGMTKMAREKLTDDEIRLIKKRVDNWSAVEPIFDGNGATAGKSIRLAEVTRNNYTMPINSAGLLCGGQARDCVKKDECGSFVGFYCAKDKPNYLILDKTTKKIVSKCLRSSDDCLKLVPREWTCASPKNMPLSISDQETFSEFRHAVSCGDILGVAQRGVSDGTYRFISKKTGEIIGTCGFWQSMASQSPCQPPKEWTCGRPTNYR